MKGIKRCRSWERSYALDTHHPRVNTRKATPRHPRTPTDITRTTVHPRPMQPTYACGIRCDQRMSPTYAYNVSLPHIPAIWHTPTADVTNISPQRMSTTYPYNISLQHIPAIYVYNISIIHIPHTYPYNISPKSTTPHAPMDISGNLW